MQRAMKLVETSRHNVQQTRQSDIAKPKKNLDQAKKTRKKPPLPEVPSEVFEKRKRSCGSVEIRKYRRGRLLGKGGFARCYLFTCCETMEIYAGKVVAKKSLKKKRAKQKLLAEIRTHKSLDHPNIVKFRNYFEDDNNVYLMLEVCHNQTMMELVRRRKRLTESEVRYYTIQMLNAMQYLHKRRIIHRDLKLGNLFLDKKLCIKLGDFGLAATLAHANERKQTICGTPNYIAPEILSGGGKGHSYEVDIWSFGCILYTTIVGKPPFQTRDVKKTYKLIKTNTYSFPEGIEVSGHAKHLIQWILSARPEQRPTIGEIKGHPFFTQGIIPKSMPLSSLRSPPVDDDGDASDAMDVDKENSTNGRNSNSAVRASTAAPVQRRGADRDRPAPELESMHAELQRSMVTYGGGKSTVPTAHASTTVNRRAAHRSTLPSPDVWVTQWVDYSAKYGLGYLMSNGSVGVYFNDSSKIVMASDGEHFEYIERTRRLRSGERAPTAPQSYVTSNFPEVLTKKVTLLKHFRTHLHEQQTPVSMCCPKERAMRLMGSPNTDLVYVKKWVRTRHAVLFRVSNRTVQVSFFDKSEIVLSSEGRVVTHKSKEGIRNTFRLDDVMRTRPDIAKRLKYTKEILHQLIKGSRK